MLAARLDEIDEALLTAVRDERWSESPTLDFKRVLPGNDDDARYEFAKDVCSFANASGGDLVYGVADVGGHASAIIPIDPATAPIDATRRRLHQILEAHVEPRLDGISMHPVPFANGHYVLVVRVHESFRKPLRSRAHPDYWRWPVRVGTRTADLTFDQIRDGFDRAASLSDRARQFRDGRLTSVLAGTAGRPLHPGPRCVVHLIPLAAIAGRLAVDVGQLHNDYLPFMMPGWGGASRTLNLEGLAVHPGGNAEHQAYVQVFRTGMFESARHVATRNPAPGFANTIRAGVVADTVRESLARFLDAARRWNVAGPAIAAVALLDIGEHNFWYERRYAIEQQFPSDRPNLIVPEVWIGQLADADVDAVARPLLDTLWQAFDLEQCGFYDADGRWIRG